MPLANFINTFFKSKLSKKRVFISGTNGLTAQYGGWDQLLRNVSERLAEEFEVICHGSFKDADPSLTNKYKSKIKLFKISANGFSSIFFDLKCLFDALKNDGICLMIGTSGGIFFPLFKFLGLKIIVNTDGFEWKRGKWNKLAKLFLLISDYLAINFSELVICDSPVIQERVNSISSAKTIYIPYGADHVLRGPIESSPILSNLEILDKEYFFSVCRIEPENSIHLFVEAAKISKEKLVIVGNWNNSKYGIYIKEKYSKEKNIFLLNPIYEQNQLASLRANCRSYIHGHTVGGTSPSLVEPMWMGLDIICINNKFTRYTTADQATYFNDVDELAEIMKKKISGNDKSSNGEKMKKLAESRYTHKKVCNCYLSAVNEVFGR